MQKLVRALLLKSCTGHNDIFGYWGKIGSLEAWEIYWEFSGIEIIGLLHNGQILVRNKMIILSKISHWAIEYFWRIWNPMMMRRWGKSLGIN